MSKIRLNDGLTMESSPEGHAVLLKSHRYELIGAWITEGNAEDFIAEQKPKLLKGRLKRTGGLFAAALVIASGYGLILGGDSLRDLWGEILQYCWVFPLFLLAIYNLMPVKEVDPPEATSVALNAESYRKLTALTAEEKTEIFAADSSDARYEKINELIALRLVRQALDQIA